MSLSIHLDDDTAKAVKLAAEENKTSMDAWIADAIRRKLATWPQAIVDLAGAWSDFPTKDDLKDLTEDIPRESL
jgi:predicted transcriptional regulator